MTAAPDRLVLASPDALVAGLPYLLGFHPVESVVVLWLRSRRLVLTQRIDLPDDQVPAPWLDAMWAHPAASTCDELVLVLVTESCDAPAVARQVRRMADDRGVRVRDALLVSAGRWRSLDCEDPDCCAPDGREVDGSTVTLVAAEFAIVGVAPVAERDELVREFDPDPVGGLAMSCEHDPGADLDELEDWRDACIEAICTEIAGSPPRPEVEITVAIRGLTDIRVRDTVLWEISHADLSARFRALALCARGTRAAPPGLVAPVATCAAIAAWLVGDGARAQIALERALADRPDYSLAQLVRCSLDAGLPPSSWAEAMSGLGRAECRHGRSD